MRKVKEVLRLRFDKGLAYRQIARSCSVSTSTAQEYVQRAESAGLGWPLPEGLNERQLHQRLFPGCPATGRRSGRPLPDLPGIHRELRRKSVTLQLLWEEYKEANPDGYQSRFRPHSRRSEKESECAGVRC